MTYLKKSTFTSRIACAITPICRDLTALLSVGLLIGVLSSCTTHQGGHEPKSASSLSAPAEAAVWTCPMHPQVRTHAPGQCPICGMNLVPAERPTTTPQNGQEKSANETSPPEGHAPLSLSLPTQQLMGVKTGKVENKPLFKLIHAPGRVAYDPELYTAQNEYQEALSQLSRVKDSPLGDVKHSALRMVESAKLRLKILGLSDSQIQKLAHAPQQDPSLLISKPGENAWVYAEVFEMDLPLITPGLEAEITADFLQGKKLQGKVASVDRMINPLTRTARVRIAVPQAKVLLRQETYVDALIATPLGKQIAIPLDALFDTGREAWVFLALPNGHFEPRKIQVKMHAGDWVAIENGLHEGDLIVTSANFLIDSESRLRSAALNDVATP